MEIFLAAFVIWLVFVSIGALLTMPAKGWLFVLAFLLLVFFAMRPSFALSCNTTCYTINGQQYCNTFCM